MSRSKTQMSIRPFMGQSDNSWLNKAKLLHPRLRELSPHPSILQHLDSAEIAISDLVPTFRLSQIPACIYKYLLMNPPIVSPGKSHKWLLITQITQFHLARLCLPESIRIPVMAIKKPTNGQLDHLLVLDHLISPMMNQSTKHKDMIWRLKTHFETAGALNSIGLDGFSKRQWASWLHCDVRSLHD